MKLVAFLMLLQAFAWVLSSAFGLHRAAGAVFFFCVLISGGFAVVILRKTRTVKPAESPDGPRIESK